MPETESKNREVLYLVEIQFSGRYFELVKADSSEIAETVAEDRLSMKKLRRLVNMETKVLNQWELDETTEEIKGEV